MIEWQEMLSIHQELSQFARIMLTSTQKQFLTSSERELVAWIYSTKTDCTPLYLSKASGMKKEAVSRCLKGLYEKDCIVRVKSSTDERSYSISLTKTGKNALQNDCEIILKTYYDLYRKMGNEFEKLFKNISTANQIISQRSADDEVL